MCVLEDKLQFAWVKMVKILHIPLAHRSNVIRTSIEVVYEQDRATQKGSHSFCDCKTKINKQNIQKKTQWI